MSEQIYNRHILLKSRMISPNIWSTSSSIAQDYEESPIELGYDDKNFNTKSITGQCIYDYNFQQIEKVDVFLLYVGRYHLVKVITTWLV